MPDHFITRRADELTDPTRDVEDLQPARRGEVLGVYAGGGLLVLCVALLVIAAVLP